MYPKEYRYSEEHEWVKVDDSGLCTVGITTFAQEELGEVVYVEFPDVGATVEAGGEIGSIESVKAVAEIYAPIGGEVIEVNEAVGDDPDVLNDDPHGAGWLVKMRPSDAAAVARLMDADAYVSYLEKGEG